MLLYDASGNLVSTLPADDLHPARVQGRADGFKHAENDAIFEQVVEHGLGCAMDRKATDEDRRRAAENVRGFAEGRSEALLIRPMRFLSRQETAAVQALPDWIRARWLALYRAGVMSWIQAGGVASGKAPVLPEIPNLGAK